MAHLIVDIRTHVQRIALGYIVPWTTLGQGGTDGELRIEPTPSSSMRVIQAKMARMDILYRMVVHALVGRPSRKHLDDPRHLGKFQVSFSIRVTELDHAFLFRGMSKNRGSLLQLLTKYLTSNNGYGR